MPGPFLEEPWLALVKAVLVEVVLVKVVLVRVVLGEVDAALGEVVLGEIVLEVMFQDQQLFQRVGVMHVLLGGQTCFQ